MRGAERVVHVDVGERRQRRGKRRVVPGLPRLVADVLQHQDLSRRKRLGLPRDVGADDRRGHRHRCREQLAEVVGDRRQRQLRLAVLGTTQVGYEDQARPAVAQLAQGRQRRPHARVIGDPTIGIERDVEVDPYQHPLAAEIPEIVQRSHLRAHRSIKTSPGSVRAARRDPRRGSSSPTRCRTRRPPSPTSRRAPTSAANPRLTRPGS